MADNFSSVIPVYRAGESLPTTYGKRNLYEMARAIAAGQQGGMPDYGDKNYLNRILMEVRSDAGTNNYNVTNTKAAKLYNLVNSQLIKEDIENPHASMYPAAVLDKLEVAKRLNISPDKAWIGTGTATTGMTGDKYASMQNRQLSALKDPRNASLLDFYARAKQDNLTPQERLLTRHTEFGLKELFGDLKQEDKYLRDNIWKLGATPEEVKSVLNDGRLQADMTNNDLMVEAYKKRAGISPTKYSKNATTMESFGANDHMRFDLDNLESTNPIVKKYFDKRMGVNTQEMPEPSLLNKAKVEIPIFFTDHVNKIKDMFSGQ